MSLVLAKLAEKKGNLTRKGMLSLHPELKYDDGRTIQSHKDETDIVKIMARFAVTGTISHLEKHEGVYADFSDFDFHTQTTMLARGNQIFAELDAEIRREFQQSPAKFFAYVNDPANIDDLRKRLPALAAPGQQMPAQTPPSADLDAAKAIVQAAEAAAKPAIAATPTPPVVTPTVPETAPPATPAG